MEPRAALVMQASILRHEIQREAQRLAPSNGASGEPDADRNPVFDDLASALRNQADEVSRIIGALNNGGDLAQQRSQFREAQRMSRNLFGESLALSLEPSVRALGLDGGATQIAEKLMSQIGREFDIPWRHLTTLSDSESFGSVSQVIRLRYPAPTLWEIPVATHELGHFAGPRWKASGGNLSPYGDFMNVHDLGPVAYLEEYFADLFAAFTVGPAYIYTCLLLRFDPSGEDGTSHPSDPNRAAWLLEALGLLVSNTGPAGKELLSAGAKRLRENWNRMSQESGAPPLDAKLAAKLKARALKLWTGFKKWRQPYDIDGALATWADYKEGTDPEEAHQATVAHVLNAAWMARLENPDDLPQAATIETWARTLLLRTA